MPLLVIFLQQLVTSHHWYLVSGNITLKHAFTLTDKITDDEKQMLFLASFFPSSITRLKATSNLIPQIITYSWNVDICWHDVVYDNSKIWTHWILSYSWNLCFHPYSLIEFFFCGDMLEPSTHFYSWDYFLYSYVKCYIYINWIEQIWWYLSMLSPMPQKCSTLEWQHRRNQWTCYLPELYSGQNKIRVMGMVFSPTMHRVFYPQ